MTTDNNVNEVIITKTSQQALQEKKVALDFYDKVHVCPECNSGHVSSEPIVDPVHKHICYGDCVCMECGCEFRVLCNEEITNVLRRYSQSDLDFEINREELVDSIRLIENIHKNFFQ